MGDKLKQAYDESNIFSDVHFDGPDATNIYTKEYLEKLAESTARMICGNGQLTRATLDWNKNLRKENELLKRQLEIAVDALNTVTATPLNSRVIHDAANKAIEQITALEQKDK